MKEIKESGLSSLFGGTVAKILDFLLIHKYDYSKAEIARYTGVGSKTLYNNWKTIEHYNLVKETRKIGRATLYKINEESPIIKYLEKLQNQILFFDAKKTVKEQLPETSDVNTINKKKIELPHQLL
ncbi:MAG: hypothetical protein ACTSP1_17735 [Candidatus Freyarchaeota archaeon]